MSEPFLALFKHQHDHHSEYAMVYSDEIEDKIDQIMLELKHCYPNLLNYRWHALKLLEGDTPMQSCWSPTSQQCPWSCPRSPGWSEFFFQATFPIFFSKKGGILCTGGCRLLAFSLTF